jgi:hypothetical protein
VDEHGDAARAGHGAERRGAGACAVRRPPRPRRAARRAAPRPRCPSSPRARRP